MAVEPDDASMELIAQMLREDQRSNAFYYAYDDESDYDDDGEGQKKRKKSKAGRKRKEDSNGASSAPKAKKSATTPVSKPTKTKEKGSGDAGESKSEAPPLKSLIDMGFIKPGENVLRVMGTSESIFATLTPEGYMQWNDEKFTNPQAWALQLKTAGKLEKSLGWNHVECHGKTLSYWRSIAKDDHSRVKLAIVAPSKGDATNDSMTMDVDHQSSIANADNNNNNSNSNDNDDDNDDDNDEDEDDNELMGDSNQDHQNSNNNNNSNSTQKKQSSKVVGGVTIQAENLRDLVNQRGGLEKVLEGKLWNAVARDLGIDPAKMTSAAFALKKFYNDNFGGAEVRKMVKKTEEEREREKQEKEERKLKKTQEKQEARERKQLQAKEDKVYKQKESKKYEEDDDPLPMSLDMAPPTEYAMNRPKRTMAKAKMKNILMNESMNPLQMVKCSTYTPAFPQPFKIRVCLEVMTEIDFHAHLSHDEVIGLLAGKIDKDNQLLTISACFPCRELVTGDDSHTNVEMDPQSEMEVRERIGALGLSAVGWYHSHPNFETLPSLMDLQTQLNYQSLFQESVPGTRGTAAPFIGVIFGPYHAALQSEQSSVNWFYMDTRRMDRGEPMLLNATIQGGDIARMPVFGAKNASAATATTNNNGEQQQQEQQETAAAAPSTSTETTAAGATTTTTTTTTPTTTSAAAAAKGGGVLSKIRCGGCGALGHRRANCPQEAIEDNSVWTMQCSDADFAKIENDKLTQLMNRTVTHCNDLIESYKHNFSRVDMRDIWRFSATYLEKLQWSILSRLPQNSIAEEAVAGLVQNLKEKWSLQGLL